MTAREKLIVALDVPTLDEMAAIVTAIGDTIATYKVGHQLYIAAGPKAIAFLKERGKRVFLDLKLHEISNSVAAAVHAAGKLGIDMVTVHASGGRKMMQAAVDAAAEFPGMQILALTVVTGLSAEDMAEIGFVAGAAEQAVRLARLAKASNCHGVIASPHEVKALRAAIGAELRIVTPGVRPAGAAIGDQSRAGTPAQAIQAGADAIIVGRPIVQAADPAFAVQQIVAEIAQAE
ncbi:MAG: orotidine-5'-phosphate decarboxylase [Caldilineaceae bacterium]